MTPLLTGRAVGSPGSSPPKLVDADVSVRIARRIGASSLAGRVCEPGPVTETWLDAAPGHRFVHQFLPGGGARAALHLGRRPWRWAEFEESLA